MILNGCIHKNSLGSEIDTTKELGIAENASVGELDFITQVLFRNLFNGNRELYRRSTTRRII